MSLVIQNVVVTLVALGAAAVFLRRALGWRRSGDGKTSCASCASGTPCDSTPAVAKEPEVRPLVLVRSKQGK